MRRYGLSTLGMTLSLSLLAAACSCGEPPTTGQRPLMRVGLEEDPDRIATYLINFGDVPVGSSRTERITVMNSGAADLVLKPAGIEVPFSIDVSVDGALIEAGGQRSVGIGFAPQEATEEPSEVIVRLETNETKLSEPRTVRIVGRGVPPGLRCTPNPVDFGAVVRGSERTLTSTCINPLETSLELGSTELRGGFAESFSVVVREDEGEILLIPPKGTITLDLRFQAESLGKNDASLMVRDVNSQLLANVELIARTVQGALVIDPAECLNFGYVDVGASSTRQLLVENVGSYDLHLTELRLPPGLDAHYSIHANPPLSLQAGSSPIALEIEFHPVSAGKHLTHLEIVTSDPRTDPVSACLSGFGGGPKLVCTPGHLDFGAVAIGMPVKQSLACSNLGEAPQGEVVDPLVIEEISSDNPAFQATFLDDQKKPAVPRAEGYAFGESFWIEVSFAPGEEGFSAGNIFMKTNTTTGEGYATPVSGEGRDLPSCDFSILPPQLNFGLVDRGGSLERSFIIQNHLETACLISDLHLEDGSDPSFSVEAIGNVELGGLEQLEVPVRFSPTHYIEQAIGRISFQISNKEAPLQFVELRGVSAFPCVVVEPNPIDFGKTGVGCNTLDRLASISNACVLPIEIVEIGVDTTAFSDDFQMRGFPNLPLGLAPNRREDFSMRFSPRQLGTLEGLAYVEYIQGGERFTRYVNLLGEGALDLEQTDTFVQLDMPKVDVLWVIDNSGSMEPFQRAVQDRVSRFTLFADQQEIDYRIGVTTTGLDAYSDECPGGAMGGENGRLFPIDAELYTPPHPRVLSRDTPNLESAWVRNIGVGICHALEQPYEAALRALSPPLINEVRDSRPNKSGNPLWNDGNAGFLRTDAALSVVVLSDEVDQSYDFGRMPLDYIEALRGIKGARLRHLVKFSAITQPHSESQIPNCGEMVLDQYGDRLILGIEETGGEWFNICTPLSDKEAWDEGLEKISRGSFGFTTRFELRGQPASAEVGAPVGPGDLVVKINGRVVPAEDEGGLIWSYDSEANAISFTPLNAPKPGAQITATYLVACL